MNIMSQANPRPWASRLPGRRPRWVWMLVGWTLGLIPGFVLGLMVREMLG